LVFAVEERAGWREVDGRLRVSFIRNEQVGRKHEFDSLGLVLVQDKRAARAAEKKVDGVSELVFTGPNFQHMDARFDIDLAGTMRKGKGLFAALMKLSRKRERKTGWQTWLCVKASAWTEVAAWPLRQTRQWQLKLCVGCPRTE